MDEKSKTIIQRFIDGEKDLFNKLKVIHEDIGDDDDIYAKYLRSLFNDDTKESFRLKRLIRDEMTKKYKPSFTSRKKDVEHKHRKID